MGYVLTGIGGILVLPALQWHDTRVIVLGLAALVGLVTGYGAGCGHNAEYAKYLPTTMTQ